MRVLDKRERYSRRDVLRAASGSATVSVAVAVTGGMVAGTSTAWAFEPKTIPAHAAATLVQMSRDIYPHDRLSDKYYAKVIADFDEKAGADADLKLMLENGVGELDAAAKNADAGSYLEMGWEADRVKLLREMEGSDFFQAIRGSLITGIYNNPDVWQLFGYEGESHSKGGYLERGFDDIDWL